jgi:hypothetical protein
MKGMDRKGKNGKRIEKTWERKGDMERAMRRADKKIRSD